MMSALALSLASRNVADAADVNAMDSEPAAPSSGQFDGERFGGWRGKLHDWEVMVGAGAIYGPKFEGSKDYKVMPVPFISATFNDYLRISPGGLFIDAYKTENFTASVKGGYDFGRDESDSPHLRGLGDIDGGGVLGGVIAYRMGPVELTAEIDKTFGGSDGLTGKLGAEVSHFAGQFIFSAGASATWADKKHMKSYFGVTSEQSARSGLATYDAGAGFKRVDLSASVTYMVSENWFIRGQAEVGFLTGDARKSPIVQKNTQPSVMMFVGYKF